jgi:hypothetical protein
MVGLTGDPISNGGHDAPPIAILASLQDIRKLVQQGCYSSSYLIGTLMITLLLVNPLLQP